MLLAIAAGPTVATWDCCRHNSDAAPLDDANFQPHGNNFDVADIAWNHNGQVIASIMTANGAHRDNNNNNNRSFVDPVVLTSILSLKPLESFRQATTPTGKQMFLNNNTYGTGYTCLSFGVKSRYLCLGDTNGDVNLFDLKKSLAVRQYPSVDGFSCRRVCFDPTESMIISLSKETLALYQLREGTLLRKFSIYDDTSGSFAFTTFHVSPFRPMIAIGTDQGCIQVLDHRDDNNTTTVNEPWNPRFTLKPTTNTIAASPVVGIAFSAKVKPLLVSVSRHGYLSFDDTQSGYRIEQRQVAERVVTSLALHPDGNRMAVGTDDGHVAVYEIRNLNDPIATLQMGDAITCLKFSPVSSSANVVGGGAMPSSASAATASASASTDGSSSRNDEIYTPTRSNLSPIKPLQQQQQQQPTILMDSNLTPSSSTALVERKRERSDPREIATVHDNQLVETDALRALIQQEVRSASYYSGGSARSRQGDVESPSTLSPADVAVIRTIVQDELAVVRDELRQHIQNLHIDMLREFVRLEEKVVENNGSSNNGRNNNRR